MKFIERFLTLLLLFCIVVSNACGSKGPGNVLPEQTESLHDFELSEDEFANPSAEFRPLWGYYNMNNSNVNKAKDWGYGGLATEMPWTNYLQNSEDFVKFAESVKYSKEQNMRVWIIDEYGWPSGKAGGQVLDEDPSLEAKGLVCLTAQTSGETVRFTLPRGHESVLAAYAIRETDGKIADLFEKVNSDGSLEYKPSDGKYVVYYIAKKPFYEGTHATQNWVQQARYPDLTRRQSTDLFIKNTHQKYYEYLSEYFGNTIEAFFTEEAQLPGYYMGDPPIKKRQDVKDIPDPDFPLLPSVNFGEKILEEFEARRRYSLKYKLHFLFGGETEEAMKVRSDYHLTVSELFRDNYNKVIAEWCEKKGVSYTGHFLFEEYTVHHAMWIGNILQQLAQQQIPSVDMLYTKPQNVRESGMTALKYAQSAADFTGKEHQAGEFSGTFEGAGNFTLEQMKGNAALHAIYGFDKFVSFYTNGDPNLSRETMREFNTYSARLSAFINKGKHIAGVAVYYPEEAIFANTLPSSSIYGGWLESMKYGTEAEKINNSVLSVTRALSKNQTDYDFLDRNFLKQCKIENGLITTPEGMQFTAFVLPYVNMLDKDVIALIEKMKAEGVEVVADKNCKVFAEDMARFGSIQRITFDSEKSLTDILYNLGSQTVYFNKNFPNARVLRQDYANAYTFVICNTDTSAYNGTVNFKVQGKGAYAYDPEDGSITPLSVSTDGSGNIVSNVKFNAYATKMFVIYK